MALSSSLTSRSEVAFDFKSRRSSACMPSAYDISKSWHGLPLTTIRPRKIFVTTCLHLSPYLMVSNRSLRTKPCDNRRIV